MNRLFHLQHGDEPQPKKIFKPDRRRITHTHKPAHTEWDIPQAYTAKTRRICPNRSFGQENAERLRKLNETIPTTRPGVEQR